MSSLPKLTISVSYKCFFWHETHFQCFGQTRLLLFSMSEKFTSDDSKSKRIITKAFNWCKDREELESRTQGSRPRTQKNSRPRAALPRTDPLKAKDRNAQGPRIQEQVFPPKKDLQKIFYAFSKKKRSSKFFHAIFKKRGLQKFFSRDLQNFNNLKNTAVLEPRTGQFSRT